MKINVEKDAPFLIITLEGRIDSYSCMEIEESIEMQITPEMKFFIFDFSRVFYISSAGLRILMKYHKYAEAKEGVTAVASLPDFALQVFELTGFDKVFPRFDTIEEAKSKFSI